MQEKGITGNQYIWGEKTSSQKEITYTAEENSEFEFEEQKNTVYEKIPKTPGIRTVKSVENEGL